MKTKTKPFNFADHDPHKVLGRPADVVDGRTKTWKLADGGRVVADNNAVAWRNKNDRLHRADGPAVINANGSQVWYVNDRLHRADGPAITRPNGSQVWYVNDRLHRADGPAITWADGSQEWYKNDRRHRPDGPAIINADGSQEWWLNGSRMPIPETQTNVDVNPYYRTKTTASKTKSELRPSDLRRWSTKARRAFSFKANGYAEPREEQLRRLCDLARDIIRVTDPDYWESGREIDEK